MGTAVPLWRPDHDTGIGIHAAANVYDGRWLGSSNAVRDRDFDLLWAMGVRHIKFVVAGDTGLEPVAAARKRGFNPIVRFWIKPPTLAVPPRNLIEQYANVGMIYAEGFTNEPELEWGRQPNTQTIEDLCVQYRSFADTCYLAKAIPITPAIQGDRFEKWFKPFIERMIARNWKDALDGSVIGGHWRPGIMPPDSPPIDQSQGGVGFVFRSYEHWHDYLKSVGLGEQPMFGTEAGYEPGDVGRNYGIHADWNVQLAQMDWRPQLWCQCFWMLLPHPHWPLSNWILNSVGVEYHNIPGCLPVVERFVLMPKPDRTSAPIDYDNASVISAIEGVNRVVSDHLPLTKWAWREGYVPLSQVVTYHHKGVSYVARLVGKDDHTFVICSPQNTAEKVHVVEYEVKL